MSYLDENQKAEEFCKENLHELCKEILEWHKTGLLKGELTRNLAKMFKHAGHHDLTLAESLIKEYAMKFVISK